MKVSKFFILSVFILIFQYKFVKAQMEVSLEDVYEHTNRNDFAINDLYRVIDRNHSIDAAIEVSIEGSISDPDFSFAIISMLPALKKRHDNLKQVKFKYYYYRDEDLQEALLINAIEKLFPNMVLDYLIERAKFGFRNDWKQSINLTTSQIDEIEDLINKPEIVQKTINEFTSTLYDDFRIQVNGIEIQLLAEFYSDSTPPLIESNCCNLELCVMNGLYRKVDLWIKGGAITDQTAITLFNSYGNANGLYFTWLGCGAAVGSIAIATAEFGTNPFADALAVASIASCLGGAFSNDLSIIEVCMETCGGNACHFANVSDDNNLTVINECENGEACVPISKNLFGSMVDIEYVFFEIELNVCHDCPGKIEIGVKNDPDGPPSSSLIFGYDEEILENTLLPNDDYRLNVIIDGITVLRQEFVYNLDPTTLEFTIFDLMKLNINGAGFTEVCFELDYGNVALNAECSVADTCLIFTCPDLEFTSKNGGLFLEVTNYNDFFLPVGFWADVNVGIGEAVEGTLIEGNGVYRLGDIDKIGCYIPSFAFNHDNSLLGQLYENSFIGAFSFEDCLSIPESSNNECIIIPGSTISVDCVNGICITDECDLVINSIPFETYVSPNTDADSPNGSIHLNPLHPLPLGSGIFWIEDDILVSAPNFPIVGLLNDCYQFSVVVGDCFEEFEVCVPGIIEEECLEVPDDNFTSQACNNIFAATVTKPVAPNISNGKVLLAINAENYLVNWEHLPGLDNSPDILDLPSGEYCVEVYRYDDCCKQRECINVKYECAEIVLDAPVINNSCESEGFIAFNDEDIEGGKPPYTLSWSNGVEGMINSNLSPGFYRLTVTDENGCTATQNYNVNNLDNPFNVEVVNSEIDCETLDYNVDIRISYPNGPLSNTASPIINVGLGNNPTETVNVIGFDPTTITFTNVPSGSNQLFIDVTGPFDGTDLSNSCDILEFDFFLDTHDDALPISESGLWAGSSGNCDNINTSSIRASGFCGSPYGCTFFGRTNQGIEVDPGQFQFNYDFVLEGDYTFSLIPNSSIPSCSEAPIISFVSIGPDPFIFGGEPSVESLCNDGCFRINIDFPYWYVNWGSQTGQSEEEICLTQSEIEAGGAVHCAEVVANNCSMNYCFDLVVDEIYSFESQTNQVGTDYNTSNIKVSSNIENPNLGEGWTYQWEALENGMNPGIACSSLNACWFSICDTSPGSYSVTITDDKGCEYVEVLEVFDCEEEFEAENVRIVKNGNNLTATLIGEDGSTIDDPVQSDFGWKWFGPNGFTSTDKTITNIEGGRYFVMNISQCMTSMIDSYIYLGDFNTCPTNLISSTVENPCRKENIWDIDEIFGSDAYLRMDLSNFIARFSNMTGIPQLNASLYIDDNLKVEQVINLTDYNSHVIRYTLPNQLYDFDVRLEFGGLVCTVSFPAESGNMGIFDGNINVEEACRAINLDGFASNLPEHFAYYYSEIANAGLDIYNLNSGCLCCETCTNIPAYHDLECGNWDLFEVLQEFPFDPYRPCSGEVTLVCHGIRIPMSVPGIPIYNPLVSTGTNLQGECIYDCGCYFPNPWGEDYLATTTITIAGSNCEEDVFPEGGDCVIEIEGKCYPFEYAAFPNDPCVDLDDIHKDGFSVAPATPVSCSNIQCELCDELCDSNSFIGFGGTTTAVATDDPFPIGSGQAGAPFEWNPLKGWYCTYDLGCISHDDFTWTDLGDHDLVVPGIKADLCYHLRDRNGTGNGDIYDIYGFCNTKCGINLTSTQGHFPDELAAELAGVRKCEEHEIPTVNEGPCIEELVPDPPVSIDGESKSVVHSDQYDGPPIGIGEEERGTYYFSGFGGVEGDNSQNYFYMQANHVACEPVLQFDHCGDNSAYWTTKLDVNGEGVICGSSNMFWRSGFCACPNEPNNSFYVGWLDGQIEDQYTQNIIKSTTYQRNTKGGRRSSLNQDVIMLGTDASGLLHTTETFGGPGDDAATSITTITPVDGNLATSNAGFAMTGYFDTGIDFSGDGSEKLVANGTDAFVAIFAADGSYIKSINNIVEGYDVRGKAISSDSEGNYILVLSVKESAQDQVGHTMVVKLSATLEILWDLGITGGEHSIDPGNLMIYNNDNMIVAGSFEETIHIGDKQRSVASGKHAGFIARITKQGTAAWIKEVGKSDEPVVLTAVSEAASNEFYLTGYFTDDVDIIANGTLDVGTETTSFIGKYQRNGVLKEIHSLGSEAFFQVNDMSSDRKGGLGLVGKYTGEVNIGGYVLPNDNGEERGFFVPLSEVIESDRGAIQDNLAIAELDTELGSKIIGIYPNPFKDQVNIEFYSDISGKAKVEVYNLNGQLVLENVYDIVEGINNIYLKAGLDDVSGVLQLKTTAVDGEVFINKIIKLE